jgi:transposase
VISLYSVSEKSGECQLRERGKHKMIIVGAIMRKLLHIVYGILKSGQPYDPAYAINCQDSA